MRYYLRKNARKLKVPFKELRFIVLILSVTSTSSADVFRWVDKNGQTHFSDQARAPTAAKEVEIDTSKMNLTTDLSSPEQLQRIAQEKDELRQKQLDALKAQKRNKPKKQDWCTWARHHLNTIVGRVVFLDENDQPVNVSEKERQARAQQLAKDIKVRCKK